MAGNQDKMKLYTVEQLLRKYDFDRIAKNKKAIEVHNNGLTKIDKELSDFVKIATNSLENLQDQVDGNITTWFFVGIPTLDSYPSNEWVTDEDKIKHLGDLYYDQDTGYAYRFALQENIYTWIKITDSDVTEALALANAAQDTADKKRRVFVATPIPPYDNGDLWFNNQEIYICQIAKEKDNVYEDGDFIIATKYTDDTLAKEVDGKLTIVSGQVTIIKEGLDEISQTVEDNKYYVDEDGNKHLISQSLSEEIQRTDLISQTVQSHSSSIQGLNPVLETEGNGQLSLPDCAGEKLLEFTVDGKSEQATRSGYNLAKTPYKSGTSKTQNGITFTVNKDGSIKMSGTSTDTAYFDIYEDGANMLMNESFTCSTGSSNADIEMQYYEHINSWQFKKATINGLLTTTPNTSATGQLFRIIITSGKTVNETLFPMILKGTYSSNTIPPFEQYGVSPSPDYPSEIKSISGVENLLKDSREFTGMQGYSEITNETYKDCVIRKLDMSDWTSGYQEFAQWSNIREKQGIDFKAGGIYTFSFWAKATSSSSYGNLFCYFYGLSGYAKVKIIASSTGYTRDSYDDGNWNWRSATDGKWHRHWVTWEIDPSADEATIAIDKHLLIRQYFGWNVEICGCMFEEGNVSHDYVPDGTNYLIEKVAGKNEFNENDYNYIPKALVSSTGLIASTTNNADYRCIYFKVKPNTEYTISANIEKNWVITTTSEFPSIGVQGTPRIVVNGKSYTIKTNADAKYLILRHDNQPEGTRTETQHYLGAELQVEKGPQATEYEEYKEAISLIDLKGNKLYSNKDLTTRDLLAVKNGLASIDKKLKEVILDGSTEVIIYKTTSNKNGFYVKTNGIFYGGTSSTKRGTLFSNKFLEKTRNEIFLEKNGIAYNSNSAYLIVYYDECNTMTVDNFKTWLSENPITVQYELATPETIDLGEVSIQTVQSDCTLELEEELETDMYAKYIKNNPYNEAYSTRLDTKAQIQLSENKIESSVSETILQNTELMQGEIDSLSSNLANNYMTSEEVQNLNNLTNDSLAVITNEFKQIQTSTQTQFQAITNILQNGVNLVKTTYITIDGNGLKIAKSTDSFNGVLDNKNLRFYSYENLMSVYSNKGAGFTNLLVTGQADIAYSKIMKVTQNGKKYTGIFYSDAMAQTLEDFIGE